jgi:NADPH2:quinone reductase
VTTWPGDRVMALTGIGGMAERALVDAHSVVHIPESMNFDVAAAFGLVYGTSCHALKQRAQLQPGETLLVLGAAGGVGLAAVEIGKAFGARVIAAASTDEKLEIARRMMRSSTTAAN